MNTKRREIKKLIFDDHVALCHDNRLVIFFCFIW